jgi:hypothetical protein
MENTQRKAQLYGAFLKAIRSVGVVELKKTSIFVRNVDCNEQQDRKVA